MALDAKNRIDIYNQAVGTCTVSFFNYTNMGNGTRIAKPATQDWTMIAEWPAGVQFYPGATQTAAGRRMLFCAGTREGVGFGRGECNLNAEGRKLFLNAVAYMPSTRVREPWVKAWNPDPPDGTLNVVAPLLKWTAGETAISHDVYVGTNPTPGPADYRGRQQHTMYFHTPLTPGATYYWRIDEVEGDGVTVHTGDVWSFTAATLTAHSPSPKKVQGGSTSMQTLRGSQASRRFGTMSTSAPARAMWLTEPAAHSRSTSLPQPITPEPLRRIQLITGGLMKLRLIRLPSTRAMCGALRPYVPAEASEDSIIGTLV